MSEQMILAIADAAGSKVMGAISDGDRGIQETVAAMQAVVAESITRAEVQAMYSRRRTDAAAWPGIVEAWLRANMRFKNDRVPYELLQSPTLMLLQIAQNGAAQGDCDDVAMLGASLLAVAGYRPVFIVVGRAPKFSGGRYEHVYYGHFIDPRGPITEENIMPFDPQERMTPGVWPDQFARVAIYPALA